MTKDQIKASLENLKAEDKILRDRADEIKAKYNRPTEWIADEDYRTIGQERRAIETEVEGLQFALNEIEDQEWVDRQALNYPDGQV